MNAKMRKILGITIIAATVAYIFRDKIKATSYTPIVAQPIGAEPKPDGEVYEYPWNKEEEDI